MAGKMYKNAVDVGGKNLSARLKTCVGKVQNGSKKVEI